ncbi:MAG: SUMF1/EgtB/PvdO family nonheme iron enzyme [Acidobacteria bacterium]|nr:SUMF1/EgtB/PvdO family nonheme iron enzyme [Acidobacteriota bacterium]
MDDAPVKRRRQPPARFDVAHWYLPDEPLLGLVKVPSGSFNMDGGGNPHQVELPDFWIARLPTTVAQFRAFLSATGFPPGNLEFLNSGDDHPVNW